MITNDAFVTLSEKLSTPLQFEYYLTRAFEEAYKVDQKPVGANMIENVLAKDINGLEPKLTREGYNAKVLAELLNAKPREIKWFLHGQLSPGQNPGIAKRTAGSGNLSLIIFSLIWSRADVRSELSQTSHEENPFSCSNAVPFHQLRNSSRAWRHFPPNVAHVSCKVRQGVGRLSLRNFVIRSDQDD